MITNPYRGNSEALFEGRQADSEPTTMVISATRSTCKRWQRRNHRVVVAASIGRADMVVATPTQSGIVAAGANSTADAPPIRPACAAGSTRRHDANAWPPEVNSFGMIGQDSLVASIEELIRYCVSKQARYPDVCLAGPPGVGKTSMSRMIAQKLQAECVLLSGSDMTSAARLISAFAEHGLFEDEMHDGAYVVARSVCFIDEAHSMGRSFVAWLLQAMDDVRLSSNEGKCYSFANVTFILATTDPGRLPSAMRSRAEPVFLRDYTLRELCGIVWLHGRKELDHDLDREVCEEIAARMRANPRRAVRSLTQAIIPHAYCQLQARDGAFDPTPSEVGRAITTNLVANYFEKKGIDVNGLDDNARSLLRYLERQGVTSEVHLCQALGISTRSDFLSLDEYVTRLGLISVSTRGRQLTSVGRRYVRQVFPLRAHIGHPSSNAEMEIV